MLVQFPLLLQYKNNCSDLELFLKCQYKVLKYHLWNTSFFQRTSQNPWNYDIHMMSLWCKLGQKSLVWQAPEEAERKETQLILSSIWAQCFLSLLPKGNTLPLIPGKAIQCNPVKPKVVHSRKMAWVSKSLKLILLLRSYSNGLNLIPGTGCGNEHPIKFRDKLTLHDDTTQMDCTVIRDDNSFWEYYTNKIPGTYTAPLPLEPLLILY